MSGEDFRTVGHGSRRGFLTVVGTATVTFLAGCSSSSDGTASTDSNSTSPENTTQTPTNQTTEDTETPEDDTPTQTPEESAGLTAEEAYRQAANRMDVDVSVDSSLSEDEQIREALIEGAQHGEINYEGPQGGLIQSETDTAYAAMAAVDSLDHFNYEDGDIAAPHLVYDAGQLPAVLTETAGDPGDLIEANGPLTDQDNLHEDWTRMRTGSVDNVYWDDGGTNSHILDSDLYETSFENVPPGEGSEEGQEASKAQFSSLAYNSFELDTGITVDNWEAWEAAEDKISNGEAKDVFDGITTVANIPSLDNFAFGYKELDGGEDVFGAYNPESDHLITCDDSENEIVVYD